MTMVHGNRRVRFRLPGPGLVLAWAILIAAGFAVPARASGPELPAPPRPVIGASGTVVILTEPAGARAWLGERFLGSTPVRVDSLPPGPAELILDAGPLDGAWRPPHRIRADVRAGETDTVRVDLRGTVAPVPPAGAVRSVRAEVGSTRSALSRLGTVLPAAAVVLGAAGAWSRHNADTAYRDYHRTLDRDRMASRFRRARNLDRVSVACWVGAEAALAGAAYVWLRHEVRVPVTASLEGDGSVRLGLGVAAAPGTGAGGARP